MRVSSLLVAALLAIAGCRASAPPERPEIAIVRAGVVHAGTKAKARAVADLLAELVPRIPASLPDCADRPVDVRVVEALERDTWGGVTYTTRDRRWIELPESLAEDALAAVMAHELVHYLLGPDWSTLPGVVEEGLCDVVAHRVAPGVAVAERAEYAVMLATAIDGALEFDAPCVDDRGAASASGTEMWSYSVRAPIDREELPSFEDALRFESAELERLRGRGVRAVLDALGFVIAERTGADELHRLCQRARLQRLDRVPPEWLFQAARLAPRDTASWRAAIAELCGAPERHAILTHEGLTIRDAR